MPFSKTDVIFVENPVTFNREFRSFSGTVGTYIARLTNEVAFRARIEAPSPAKLGTGRTGINYSTGRLAAGIRTGRAVGHSVGIGTGAGVVSLNAEVEGHVIALPHYAIYVIKGTSPHKIRPRRAPRLVFFWARKGRVVSLPSVSHPGTPENPFLQRALIRTIR